MIRIEFTAETAGELNDKIKQYVGQLSTMLTRPAENAIGAREAFSDASDVAVNIDTGKDKKRAPRAPKAPQTPVEDVVEEEHVVGAPTPTAAELLDLKAKTMETLQAAFNAGKINKLRALLNEHGGGAKSFPEVAIEQFPAIRDALQNGALE